MIVKLSHFIEMHTNLQEVFVELNTLYSYDKKLLLIFEQSLVDNKIYELSICLLDI